MARLVPTDALLSIGNRDERRVVKAMSQMPGPWLVMPNKMGRDGNRDWETDVVLVHPDHGVVIVEVKGYIPRIVGGQWQGHPPDQQPAPDQARGNASRLERQLRNCVADFRGRQVEHAVCFVNAKPLGELPSTGLQPEQVITGDALGTIETAIDHLVAWSKKTGRVEDRQIQAIVDHLCPDSTFQWDRESLAALAREEMRSIAEQHIDSLRTLRQNRRVAVSGSAGTGKTRLAVGWARDAARDDETARVLVTCFNEPLCDMITNELAVFENIRVQTILRLFADLLTESGRPPDGDPESDPGEYWDCEVPVSLHANFQRIIEQFDVIIIDEAQDFSPAWIGMLEALLAPDGDRQLLMVFDEAQGIYKRGFRPPEPADGWVVASLTRNCRNADEIARLLYRAFGAARPVSAAPAALGYEFREAGEHNVVEVVGSLLAMLAGEGRDPRHIVVQTMRNNVRTSLRNGLGLVGWEQWSTSPGSGHVLCENVHRLKGLEFDTVIFVAMHNEPEEDLLYVGISRAVSELFVVGPRELAERLRLQ
jgi:hypothetical protein